MKMYELFSRPGTWVQHKLAVNAEGKEIHPLEQRGQAVGWCLLGGALECYSRTYENYCVRELLDERLGRDVVGYNNTKGRTREEIVALCKELDI